jgi:hypothetical protein
LQSRLTRLRAIPSTLSLLSALLGVVGPASADRELALFTPEIYGDGDFCCESCDDLPNAIGDGAHFDDGFASYDEIVENQNTTVDGRDFADSGWFAWGADSDATSGTDWADVIFYSGHGSATCDPAVGHYSSIVMGEANQGEVCSPRTADRSGSSNGHMHFGGPTPSRDANAFVTFSCKSAHKCVWENGGYSPVDNGQFNIWNGFHGTVFEVNGYQDDLEDYAEDAEWNDIGDAWLDHMYRWRKPGENNCPVAILWGANDGEMDDFYGNAGWYDFHNTGSHGYSNFYYLNNCNPKNGPKL